MSDFLHIVHTHTHTHTIHSNRNSLVEVLRIVASFIIVIHHFAGNAIIEFNGLFLDKIFYFFAGHCGVLGNCIFSVISAYYLCKSKKMQFNKVIYLLLFELLIGLLSFAVRIILKMPISKGDIGLAIAPFLFNDSGIFWFVNAYIFYYLIHTYLNRVLDSLSKTEHLSLLLFIIPLYTVFPFLTRRNMPMSIFTGFIIIHIIILYFDKYIIDKKISRNQCIWISMILLFLHFFILMISYDIFRVTKINVFNKFLVMGNTTYDFFMLFGLILLIFALDRIKYSNSFINKWASLSLLIFMIHLQRYASTIIMYNQWIYLESNYSLNEAKARYLLVALIWYLVSLFFSIVIYYIFNKHIIKFSECISMYCNKIVTILNKYI